MLREWQARRQEEPGNLPVTAGVVAWGTGELRRGPCRDRVWQFAGGPGVAWCCAAGGAGVSRGADAGPGNGEISGSGEVPVRHGPPELTRSPDRPRQSRVTRALAGARGAAGAEGAGVTRAPSPPPGYAPEPSGGRSCDDVIRARQRPRAATTATATATATGGDGDGDGDHGRRREADRARQRWWPVPAYRCSLIRMPLRSTSRWPRSSADFSTYRQSRPHDGRGQSDFRALGQPGTWTGRGP